MDCGNMRIKLRRFLQLPEQLGRSRLFNAEGEYCKKNVISRDRPADDTVCYAYMPLNTQQQQQLLGPITAAGKGRS